jgi:RimJ/RimL family protein N-acetyltransferase
MSTTPSTPCCAAWRRWVAEIVAETKRLRLREWEDADEVRFYDVMNRPEVMDHLGGLQSPEEWRAAYSRVRACQAQFGHAFWIVEDRQSGEILGFCGIKRVNSPGTDMTGQHEIGWRLRPEAWGKGIAKEAAIASLDLAFGRFAAPHVIALTVAQNEASWGLMHRLGLKRRADLDFADSRFGPELNPNMVYRIEAEEWPAAREAALT